MLTEEFDEIYFGEDETEEATGDTPEKSSITDEAEAAVGEINPALNANVENESSRSQPEITIESPEIEPEVEPEVDPEADLDQEDKGEDKDEPNFG